MKRLPEHEVQRMQAMRQQGYSLTDIGIALGRHRATVYRCLQRDVKPPAEHWWPAIGVTGRLEYRY